MADPNYMKGDSEIYETYVSTDENGGTLFMESKRVSKEVGMSSGRIIHPEYLEDVESVSLRQFGVPRTDVERAMNHYNITEAEYLAHPENYPLPPRGSGIAWPPKMPMHSIGVDWEHAYHFGSIAEPVRGVRRQG